MASIPIPNLPAAVALNGSEEIPAVQNGVAVRITTTQIVSVGTGLALPWSVQVGGTGQTSLTQHGVVIGNGISPVDITAAGNSGQVLAGNTGADPSFQTLSTLIASMMISLPTSLPGSPGQLWNDGGVLAIS